MTTGVINGTLVGVYVDNVLIGNATSGSISISHSGRDTSSKDDGGWTTMLEGQREFSVSADGFVAYDATNGLDELLLLITNRTKVTLKFSTEVVGDTRLTGDAFCTSISSDSPNEESSTFSVEFQGTGALTKETVT